MADSCCFEIILAWKCHTLMQFGVQVHIFIWRLVVCAILNFSKLLYISTIGKAMLFKFCRLT